MTLIEVLVTVFILVVGLLGMAGLQSRLQQSEMEAYQRSQALLLLQDMAGRMTSNRNAVAGYVSTGYAAGACPASTTTQKDRDLSEWCNAIQGAGETSGTSKVGAMIGGRGCVASLGSGQYLITVAWQGLTPQAAPPSSVSCGQNNYNGGNCVNDQCRRVATTVVRIATL